MAPCSHSSDVWGTPACIGGLKAVEDDPAYTFRVGLLNYVKQYSLEVQTQNLYIGGLEGLSQGSVFLMGDGFSGLGLAMFRSGQDVQMADPVYNPNIDFSGVSEELQSSVAAYRQELAGRLHPVSALESGFADDSFDWVFSHMLINELGISQAGDKRAIVESIRTLKPGGIAVHAFRVSSVSRSDKHELVKNMRLYDYLMTLSFDGGIRGLSIMASDVYQSNSSLIPLEKPINNTVVTVMFIKPE